MSTQATHILCTKITANFFALILSIHKQLAFQVGAVGTAALLDVPQSLESLLKQLHNEGYDVGDFATDPDATGESLVAALAIMSEAAVIALGGTKMQDAINSRIDRAKAGDKTTAATLALPGGGLGGAKVKAYDVTRDELDDALGKYMAKKVEKAWSSKDRGPGVSSRGDLVVSGLQLGNVWIGVQPLLGVEGDPMRLLFERDLTPHPQVSLTHNLLATLLKSFFSIVHFMNG